ncbi:MAG: HyaD/HybD family hydrogenase maturation endopeptidase [Halieaceae bacterium]|jgi:hydrogenase maturation protease|nr:HyaD/HybD family hydrogenase maturation endopeptidase [Halieaceae bacterium]
MKALALGVGNLLWADEGFGVRCVEALAERYQVPENLTVADGGTQGLYLVDLLREYDPVVIFDAVDFGDQPGSIRVVENDAIPAFVAGRKVSLHQAGLQDVIACAKLLGDCAENMLLVGVQPVELEDYGGSLRPAVRAQIPRCLEIAADFLAGFGIELTPLDQPGKTSIITPGLELERYEADRPDSNSACRQGDARVLQRARVQ